MKRLLVIGLFSVVMLNGCSKCSRETPPPPSVAPGEVPPDASDVTPDVDGAPGANPEAEPVQPTFPNAPDSGDVQDESVD